MSSEYRRERFRAERSDDRPTKDALIAAAIETINSVPNPVGIFMVVKGQPDFDGQEDISVRQVFNTADAEAIYTATTEGLIKAITRFENFMASKANQR